MKDELVPYIHIYGREKLGNTRRASRGKRKGRIWKEEERRANMEEKDRKPGVARM